MEQIAKKFKIPEISDAKLAELVQRIKPVVRMARVKTSMRKTKTGGVRITQILHLLGKMVPWESGRLHYIRPVDPRSVAYTWEPKHTKEARGLQPIRDITTLHTYGFYGFFKPSIAEVLAQIPEDILDSVVAFEIVKHPETADDLNKDIDALNAGFHVATTRLYTKK